MKKTFTKIGDNFFFFFYKIFKNFVLFVLFFTLMLISKVLLLVHFFDFEFLISLRKFFVIVNDFIEFLFLFFNMRLNVRQFIICVFFNDPF